MSQSDFSAPKTDEAPSFPTPGTGVEDNASLQQQIDALRARMEELFHTHSHDGLDSTRVNLDETMGLFETVDTPPTAIPKSIYDQVKLYDNGSGLLAIYWYDVVARVWRFFGITNLYHYAGRVSSAGTINDPAPAGWTAARPNTGEFIVTHNLGDIDYSVVATPDDDNAVCYLDDRSANSFTIRITTLVNVASNEGFTFLLSLNPDA